jgi:integrase
LTFVLPHRIVKLMDIHWKLFRRGKACETSLRLLPGFVHAGRDAHHLSHQLAKFTARELGRRISAHQFRVLTGYIFLKRNPGCYEAVRRFLGHKSIRTTMTYYAFMLDDEAFEQLDQTIDDLLGD